jgi:hypothetical protein
MPEGERLILRKPHIRKRTYYLLSVIIIALNINNVDGPGTFGGQQKFPIMGMIGEIVAAILGYIVVRIVIANLTEVS